MPCLVITRGLTGPATGLITLGFGDIFEPCFFNDQTVYGRSRHGKDWLEEAWWLKSNTFTVKAALSRVNETHVLLTESKSITKTYYDDNINIKAEIKSISSSKTQPKNIFINAFRILRNN